jgi:hypothetical protein
MFWTERLGNRLTGDSQKSAFPEARGFGLDSSSKVSGRRQCGTIRVVPPKRGAVSKMDIGIRQRSQLRTGVAGKQGEVRGGGGRGGAVGDAGGGHGGRVGGRVQLAVVGARGAHGGRDWDGRQVAFLALEAHARDGHGSICWNLSSVCRSPRSQTKTYHSHERALPPPDRDPDRFPMTPDTKPPQPSNSPS